MKWTEKQSEAITKRNKNLLVSAAAGSGKTAVLVERIKRLILQENASVDRFLIVTFTNAASKDMKRKLLNAINRHILENPSDAALMKKQLSLLNHANISTFHAFCLEVIRRYFYIIDADPNFRICDEAEAVLLKASAMDTLFEEYFDESSPEFIEFLKSYASSKNENKIREMILQVFETLSSVPDGEKWLEKFGDERAAAVDAAVASGNLGPVEDIIKNGPVLSFIRNEAEIVLENFISCADKVSEMIEQVGAESLLPKCAQERDWAQSVLEELPDMQFDRMSAVLAEIPNVKYLLKKTEKEDYEPVKELISKLRRTAKGEIKSLHAEFFSETISGHADDIVKTMPFRNILVEMVRRFTELYGQEKTAGNLIDFSDIEHMALKILSHSEAADEYREKFEYIFVDEYQDSNRVQEALLDCIKRENNLFMVGDVKQSIYKFRLAEPELFMQRYSDYKGSNDALSENIDMNTNFRSTKTVVDTINTVFRNLMGSAYDENAELHLGAVYPEELLNKSEFYLVETGKKKKEAEGDASDDSSQGVEAAEADESSSAHSSEEAELIEELEKAEREALAAADIIQKAVEKKQYVRYEETEGSDGEKHLYPACRSFSYGDIAILMRSTKASASKFQKILMDRGIPVHIDDSDGYYDTLEIEIFINLLRVIDNRRQDIPLIGTLYSVIFGFDASQLAEVRIHCRKGSYFDALCDYAADENADPALRKKISDALESLELWRRRSLDMPLDEFIWQLMWDTGYYNYVGTLPAGVHRQANLRVLTDHAVAFLSNHMNGIYSFVQYIDQVRRHGAIARQVSLSQQESDCVRIMTIHKSKGLEFPMTIVAGLGRQFAGSKNKKGLCIDKDFGLALYRSDREKCRKKTTLLQNVINRHQKRGEREEEIRVLYVAMTRAMDYLVLLGGIDDLSKLEQRRNELEANPLSAKSFCDMLIPILREDGVYSFENGGEPALKTPEDSESEQEKNTVKPTALQTVLEGKFELPSDEIIQETDRKLDYRYVSGEAKILKSKYTVTELNEAGKAVLRRSGADSDEDGPLRRKDEDELDISGQHENRSVKLKIPGFALEKKGLAANERGTVVHAVAEKLDFAGLSKAAEKGDGVLCAEIEKYIERLVVDEILLPAEAEAVSVRGLARLVKSGIGKRMAASPNLRRELPFTMISDVQGHEALVQGVIDACFTENDNYVIVDYKTNYMKDDSQEEIDRLSDTYRGQLTLYKEALEGIYGKKVKEAYLYLFAIDKEIRVL
ncbi:MAG: helicase-exonuclease AddAB subunit AddA [Clostridia bacterium]|nr:helicase-exonuclease AddAB subunit AddA [Clostridia bacterium]